jgi:endonuclease/exonuclease/phosphatase family metal-dependent hydrolase
MTWNIHGALGRNPRFDLDRVIGFVRRHDPDIVALQEVDSRRARAAGTGNPFDILRDMLGHGAHAHAVSTADGDYGQILISRWPMSNVEILDLSYRAREPRRAICSDIATPAGPMRIVATHLGLSFHERRSQAVAILKALGSIRHTTVALGDFNDWIWPGSVGNRLKRALPAYTNFRTFPAWLPCFRLDRVYAWPATALVSASTDQTARAFSDHMPVIAELRIV